MPRYLQLSSFAHCDTRCFRRSVFTLFLRRLACSSTKTLIADSISHGIIRASAAAARRGGGIRPRVSLHDASRVRPTTSQRGFDERRAGELNKGESSDQAQLGLSNTERSLKVLKRQTMFVQQCTCLEAIKLP